MTLWLNLARYKPVAKDIGNGKPPYPNSNHNSLYCSITAYIGLQLAASNTTERI